MKYTQKMKKHFFRNCLLAVFTALFAWACNDDDFNGIDNFITEFRLTAGDAVYPGAVVGDTVFFVLDYETDLSGAVASYALSENAKISPDPKAITDWSTDQRLTVTSKNGNMRTYYVKTKRVPGPDSYITGFGLTIGEETYQGAIIKNTITVSVPGKADLTQAIARVELSAKATITPDPASIEDWGQKQVFTVKTDTATRTFEVNVERQPIMYYGTFMPRTTQDIDDFLAAGYTHISGDLNLINLVDITDDLFQTKESMLIEISGDILYNNVTVNYGKFLKNLKRVRNITVVSSEHVPNLEIVEGSLGLSPQEEGVHEFPKLKRCDAIYSTTKGNHTYKFPELRAVYSRSTITAGKFILPKIERLPMMRGSFEVGESLCEVDELYLKNAEELAKFPALKKVPSLEIEEATPTPNIAGLLSQVNVSNLTITSVESGEYDFSSLNMLSSFTIKYTKDTNGNINLKLPQTLDNLYLGGTGKNSVSGIENITGKCELTPSWDSALRSLKNVGTLWCKSASGEGMAVDLSGINSITNLTISSPLSFNKGKFTTFPGTLKIFEEKGDLSFLKGITLVGTLEIQSTCMDYSDFVELAKKIDATYPDDAPLRWKVKHPQGYRYTAPKLEDMLSGDPERYKVKSAW